MSKGSIYILENPALREHMLKIGRTEGTSQKTAKQLFTTGLRRSIIFIKKQQSSLISSN